MGVVGAVVVPHPPLIMPEIGRGEEEKIRPTIDAYREAMRRMAVLSPDTVVISSPHATMYADYFHISPREHAEGDFGDFRVPGLKLAADYDTDFVKTLSRCLAEAGVDGGTGAERMPKLDHGTMVPLRFVQEAMPDVKIVRVGLSGLSPRAHYRFGECVARAAELLNRRVVYVASGDLSHKLKADGPYGFAAEGPVFDKECMAALAAGDFLRLLSIDAELSEGAAECGLRSFWMMAGALDRRKVEAEQLSYEGPFGVGYGVAFFVVGGRDGGRAFGDLFEKAAGGAKSGGGRICKAGAHEPRNFRANGKTRRRAEGFAAEAFGGSGGGFRLAEKGRDAAGLYWHDPARDGEPRRGNRPERGFRLLGGPALFPGDGGRAGRAGLQC